MTRRVGFTLIELLVVVLIIGILSAVALPQYQRAVEKARAMQAISIVKAIGDAQEIYFLENGEYSPNLDLLSIKIPGEDKKGDSIGFGTLIRKNYDQFQFGTFDGTGQRKAIALANKYDAKGNWRYSIYRFSKDPTLYCDEDDPLKLCSKLLSDGKQVALNGYNYYKVIF
ncbi:MAG: prepilin-type N-terminal cleavage/methylation domain-containing protein [Elusimicrobiaceae bacterium]|nr:prepilin-type N-terminal cleavage/methylation domain-containing protein [Elusimicrobiaceae bacterium]